MRGGRANGRALAWALAGVWTASGCADGGEVLSSGMSLGTGTGTATEPATTTAPDGTTTAPGTATTTGGSDEVTGSVITMGPQCGDGVVDAMEECDDADLDNTNDCTNSCKLPACGDSFVQPPEACDDGNPDDTDDCTNTCTAAACGDGFVQAGIEACDDGNMMDGDECSSLCTIPGCGDGVVDPMTEECDDANPDNTDACTAACKNAVCGDGILLAAGEECDDGNVNGGDGCESDCTITQKFTAVGPQINFPEASLSGWTICFTGTYEQVAPPVADILAQCTKANLMLACRPIGAPNFTLLAHAPREPVLTDTGMSNTPTNANGVGWYFNDSFSWGFAKEGDPINRSSCDFPIDAVNGELRLCWHTGAGNLSSGYRCGTTDLNDNPGWERVVLHAD
jgi:cysteine-rich repeat protein